MKVVVTGGAGYLGSALIRELLAGGHEVCVYDSLLFGDVGLRDVANKPRLSIVIADIRDHSLLATVLDGAHAVIHLAALVGDPACRVDPGISADVNTAATAVLASVARRAGVGRLIFSSTCSNYGVSDPSSLADEETRLNPVSVYAETKVAAEQAVLAAASSSMAVTVFRFATLFGMSSRMRFDLLLNELVRDAASAKRIEVYGPSAWRPFLHIRDAVTALQCSLTLSRDDVGGRVFNVAGSNHRKRELAELILAVVPDAAVEYNGDRPDPRDYRVSAARWNALTKPERYITALEGIGEMVGALRSGVLGDPYRREYRNVE